MICKYIPNPSCGLHFHSVHNAFWCMKFKFSSSNLSFLLLPVPLMSHSRNCHQIQWCSFVPHSSKSFIVLPFMFRSLIQPELVFVYGIRQGSNFILFACGNPGEKFVLSLLSVLGILIETHLRFLCVCERVYFCVLTSISFVSMSVFMLVPHWSDYSNFVILWNSEVQILQLCSSFCLSSSLEIPYEFQDELFYFCKKKNT